MFRKKLSQLTRADLKISAATIARTAGGVLVCALIMFTATSTRKGGGNIQGYGWRMELSVSGLASGSDWRDFPVMVRIRHEDLRNVSNGGKVHHPQGYDIRFTGGDGATPLLHKIQKYDAQTGEITALVSVDTLYAGKATRLNLYFGNPEVSTFPSVYTDSHYFRSLLSGETGLGEGAPPQELWIEAERKSRNSPEKFLSIGPVTSIAGPFSSQYEYLRAALKGGSFVIVEWGTRHEEDNDFFVIERSADGKRFESMGEMGGDDYSDTQLTYSLPDMKPYPGKTFYRVKQVDNDGDFSYSEIIYVEYNAAQKGLNISGAGPDPVLDKLEVSISTDRPDNVTFELYTVDGTLVITQKELFQPGQYKYALPGVAALPPGVYVLSVMGMDRRPKTFRINKK